MFTHCFCFVSIHELFKTFICISAKLKIHKLLLNPELTFFVSVMSDLIGDVQEIQPVSNISTAADLLKQGAGEFSTSPHTHSSFLTCKSVPEITL